MVVCGSDMTKLSDKALRHARQSIGMIFQGFHLLMQRTAEENICFPLLIAGVKKADAQRRAKELLELVGLGDRGGAYPAQLSGGQNSASPLPGRWRRIRRFCSAMRRRARSIPPPRSRFLR